MKKLEVQEAALSRLETMEIPVAPHFREPVSAIVNKDIKTWLGFLQINLLNLERAGISLLKGNRIFTLQLQNSEYVIGKVKKGFDFTSAAFNRHLKFKNEALSNYTSRQLLGELIQLGYILAPISNLLVLPNKQKNKTPPKLCLPQTPPSNT